MCVCVQLAQAPMDVKPAALGKRVKSTEWGGGHGVVITATEVAPILSGSGVRAAGMGGASDLGFGAMQPRAVDADGSDGGLKRLRQDSGVLFRSSEV